LKRARPLADEKRRLGVSLAIGAATSFLSSRVMFKVVSTGPAAGRTASTKSN
jgi:hypothetical protein